MECPICNGTLIEQEEPVEITYKKIKYNIIQYFSKCNKCEEEFTSLEEDEKTLNQIPNYGTK